MVVLPSWTYLPKAEEAAQIGEKFAPSSVLKSLRTKYGVLLTGIYFSQQDILISARLLRSSCRNDHAVNFQESRAISTNHTPLSPHVPLYHVKSTGISSFNFV